MAKYYSYKFVGAGVVLYHSDGADYCPSRFAAEQKLLAAVHNWAAENIIKAKEQMELLTALIRS